MNFDVVIEPGKPGQFDVIVDGEVIATKSRKLLQKLTFTGFPKHEDVLAKLEELKKVKS
ncbi:MAG: hypothetical protein P1V97_24615 [Planctomycetota bacterium]|nr:hypothetical protein [Planctomycetota bacterium]